jgi:hypothetical protein
MAIPKKRRKKGNNLATLIKLHYSCDPEIHLHAMLKYSCYLRKNTPRYLQSSSKLILSGELMAVDFADRLNRVATRDL